MTTVKTKWSAGWKFQGDLGDFRLEEPHRNSYLYFPLVNEAGMMSAITPILHGDMKTGQSTFLLPPVSAEDLHNSRAARNFWVYAEGIGAWSAGGNSAIQTAARYGKEDEKVTLDAGFLWHRLTRENALLGLRSQVTNFVPNTADAVELMKITIRNTGSDPLRFTPTVAIPIYGRSADDIRDHRHVTSLLQRINTHAHGVEVQPSLSFDENGHRVNEAAYGVFGAEGGGEAPVGFFPVVETFIGEGGTLDWPEAVVSNLRPNAQAGENWDGYEALGGLRFREVELAPGQEKSYIVAMQAGDTRLDVNRIADTYLTESAFDSLLEEVRQFWHAKLDTVTFGSGDRDYNLWMKWVTLQPILRRLYGCSFLPHHDYGRGGRGWRDLWQDCLALMLMEPAEVRHLLLNNYAGVRIDGSNATIIGVKPGEFIADRNNIPRVWMDHGTWPFATTLLYLNQSGDMDFLFEDQTYFKDIFASRCRERDANWTAEDGNRLRTASGEVYHGTILEHILLQNLIPFYNVGAHNNIKLEGADWNDGLDMASAHGESVAFTAFYAGNLLELSKLLLRLQVKTGRRTIELAEEITVLFDTLDKSIEYGSVEGKHELLERYYDKVKSTVSGRKVEIDICQLAADLAAKSGWMIEHLRTNEWISSSEGFEWFNGYYNNDGERVEGDHEGGVRMTLTGQVFSIMCCVASDAQVRKASQAVDRYLRDPRIGYRLNTSFGGIQQNLGRAFGFAFGHKENGAMFSHMTVMYANALYKRGFVKEGHAVLDSIYRLSTDFQRSRIYPGIPEYINENGRGMYHYLTGSASWLLLTVLTEVFGVKGKLGDLQLEPKLIAEQFDSANQASVVSLFAGRKLRIVYRNPNRLDYGVYRIQSVSVNGRNAVCEIDGNEAVLERAFFRSLPETDTNLIEVNLG